MNPLGFTEEWYQLGIVTPERVQEMEALFATGADPNTEHYRHRAFVEFLSSSTLTTELAEALYALAESDPDSAAGDSMRFAIIDHKSCPAALRHRVAESGLGSVSRRARKLLGL